MHDSGKFLRLKIYLENGLKKFVIFWVTYIRTECKYCARLLFMTILPTLVIFECDLEIANLLYCPGLPLGISKVIVGH